MKRPAARDVRVHTSLSLSETSDVWARPESWNSRWKVTLNARSRWYKMQLNPLPLYLQWNLHPLRSIQKWNPMSERETFETKTDLWQIYKCKTVSMNETRHLLTSSLFSQMTFWQSAQWRGRPDFCSLTKDSTRPFNMLSSAGLVLDILLTTNEYMLLLRLATRMTLAPSYEWNFMFSWIFLL